MTHRPNSLIVLIAFVSVTCVSIAAQVVASPPSRLVRLFTTAVDAQQTTVSDLNKDDFVVLDDGKPVPTQLYQVDVEPIVVMVMIDRSASMSDTFERLVSAVDEFTRTLGPDDQLRAGTFSDKVQFTSRFTSNRGEAIDELKKLPFGNGTKLHDALLASFDELKGKPGLRVVVIITDGDDTGSRGRRDTVLKRERMDDVVVYAIGLETQYNGGLGVIRNRPGRPLRELAELTGGSFNYARQMTGVTNALSRIRQELRSHYVLGFTSPADGRVHTVTVQAKRPGITVRSRRSYLASSLTAP
jgi:Ca-activated chloride channel homolog